MADVWSWVAVCSSSGHVVAVIEVWADLYVPVKPGMMLAGLHCGTIISSSSMLQASSGAGPLVYT